MFAGPFHRAEMIEQGKTVSFAIHLNLEKHFLYAKTRSTRPSWLKVYLWNITVPIFVDCSEGQFRLCVMASELLVAHRPIKISVLLFEDLLNFAPVRQGTKMHSSYPCVICENIDYWLLVWCVIGLVHVDTTSLKIKIASYLLINFRAVLSPPSSTRKYHEIQWYTDNDRYSVDRFSGNDGFSGTNPPDDAILFTVSGITV